MIIGTLGPAGSNHDWVAQKYCEFHHLDNATVTLFSAFESAFDALLDSTVDFVLQVAVHPSVTETVARYRGRAHLVDTFISPSQSMAVLVRRDVDSPTRLGLQMATRDYIDTERWTALISEPSTIAVRDGLVAGKYDAGITLSRFYAENEELLRLDEEIGTVVDPWLVYGREPVTIDSLLAWPDSPARKLYRQMT